MRVLLPSLLLFSISTGCASTLLETRDKMLRKHALEQRVVNEFVEALQEDNEAALRKTVSTRFEQKAMRSRTAFQDLEILKLPEEQLTVVEAEETDDQNRVVVVAEEDGTKYQFLLTRDDQKRRWVVDDVKTRQKKKGTRSARSTTEVMDLLLTLREFLDTWQTGGRDEVLSVTSAGLRSTLQELPEPWLHQLIRRVNAEYETGMARRPEAQLSNDEAVVKLPAKNGFLLVKMSREVDVWRVADVEIHNRKIQDHPGSISRQASAMNTVTRFLHGYQKQDLNELKLTSTANFYEGSLQFGDLSMISLPPAEHAPDNFEIRAFAGQLTVMIPQGKDIVRLDLTEPVTEKNRRTASSEVVVDPAERNRFLVGEVIIYDQQTAQQRNLSSAFTAPTRAMVFMSALEDRNLEMLQQISTLDFSKGTWDRVNRDLFAGISLDGIPSGELKLENSRVRGSRTELDFLAETGQVLSVILTDENGQIKVDDVQYPDGVTAAAGAVSLRNRMELVIAMTELADAWRRQDLAGVQKACSGDFNRLVWSNLSSLPSEFADLPARLTATLQQSQVSGRQAEVVLNPATDSQSATTVRLLAQQGHWLVDEISFNSIDGARVELRSSLRQDLAQRFLREARGQIQQVAHRSDQTEEDPLSSSASEGGGVTQARAEFTGPAGGNLTLPPQTVSPLGKVPRTGPIARPHTVDQAPAQNRLLRKPRQTADRKPAEESIQRFGPDANRLSDTEAKLPPEAASPVTGNNSETIDRTSAEASGPAADRSQWDPTLRPIDISPE